MSIFFIQQLKSRLHRRHAPRSRFFNLSVGVNPETKLARCVGIAGPAQEPRVDRLCADLRVMESDLKCVLDTHRAIGSNTERIDAFVPVHAIRSSGGLTWDVGKHDLP